MCKLAVLKFQNLFQRKDKPMKALKINMKIEILPSLVSTTELKEDVGCSTKEICYKSPQSESLEIGRIRYF